MSSKTRSSIPSQPPTATHQLIKTKEGTYWRAKRGLYTPVELNPTVQAHAEAMRAAAPAARRIAAALEPYTADLQKGRLIAAISGRLLRCLKAEGRIRLGSLSGLELQPDYPLMQLLNASYISEIEEAADIIRVRIARNNSIPVKLRNKLIDSYEVTAVFLYGNAAEDSRLHIQAVSTGRLPAIRQSGDLVLNLPLEKNHGDFLLALRVECFEGRCEGLHPGLRAMRVIESR